MDLIVLEPGGAPIHSEVKAPKDPLFGTKEKTPLPREQKKLIRQS